MAEAPNFGSITVLVFDDELFMRGLISRTLTEMGVGQVLTANNGQ